MSPYSERENANENRDGGNGPTIIRRELLDWGDCAGHCVA
jgi:hypothetical protein